MLHGLPCIGVDEQKVGVANDEQYGLFRSEKGLGEILFWIGKPPIPPGKIFHLDSDTMHFFVMSSTYIKSSIRAIMLKARLSITRE